MIVAVCVDDKNGMMFNKRRQSQDRIQRQHLRKLAEGRMIWMKAQLSPASLSFWRSAPTVHLIHRSMVTPLCLTAASLIGRIIRVSTPTLSSLRRSPHTSKTIPKVMTGSTIFRAVDGLNQPVLCYALSS